MTLLKGSAWYLLFMATLHSVVGLCLRFDHFKAMILDGVGTIAAPHYDRLAILWFLFSGALMFILAYFAFWAIKHTGTLPKFLGPTLAVLGIAGVAIIPDSGLWLYIPIGIVLTWVKPHQAGQVTATKAA